MSDTIISTLVSDLRAATAGIDDPAEAIARVRPIVARMADDTSWMKPAYYETDDEQGFGINILNEEPDNTLLVEVICWAPGRGVAPHDHQTWGVVVGIDGTEVNVGWRRKDDGSKPGFADLELDEETDVTNGVVCTLMPDDIHGVRNDGDKPSVSLHVYGKVLASLNRSEFDPINRTQKPCPQRKRTPANA
ncbi:MAG: cysteine dioxygenase family protein [Rhodospirillales bacterium]|mgnify:CR=1 FL=1